MDLGPIWLRIPKETRIRHVTNYLAFPRDREEFLMRLPGALRLVQGCVDRQWHGRVGIEGLLMTKQLSRDSAEYEHKVAQALAAKQLVQEDIQTSAGPHAKLEHRDGSN